MGSEYVKMLLEGSLEIERSETCSMIESIESESNYIFNIINFVTPITEKAMKNANEKSAFGKFIDLIKNIFTQFKNKVHDIVIRLKPWKEETLSKLDSVSFNNMSIKAFPHWNIGADDIINEIKSMQNEFKKAIRDTQSDDRLESIYNDMGVDDIIKNNPVFKKYHTDDGGYKVAMERIFSTKTLSDYKTVTVTSASEIKRICMIGKEYILKYEDIVNQCNALHDSLIKDLEIAEQDYKRSVNETYNPYLILEDSYLFDTDMMCYPGASLLFEAETAKNNQSANDNNKEKSSDIEVETKDGGDQNQSAPKKPRGRAAFEKNIAKINVDAITIAISVIEKKLYVYRALITEVVKASGKSTTSDTNTKVESKSDNAGKSSKKKNIFGKKK